MIKKQIDKHRYEWHWTQVHRCGHKTEQRSLGGAKPLKTVEQLRAKLCPSCELRALMAEHFANQKTG